MDIMEDHLFYAFYAFYRLKINDQNHTFPAFGGRGECRANCDISIFNSYFSDL